MNVRHVTEVRKVNAVYFSGGEKGLNMSVTGSTGGWVTEGATSVKVVALVKGGYSVRCVGKGGFSGVRYVKDSDFMVLVSPGGVNFRTGFVSAMYERARRESRILDYLDRMDDSVRGCSCGMADFGAPGHDGHDE